MNKAKEKMKGLMQQSTSKTQNMMNEMGTELGLSEQPKVSSQKKTPSK